MEIDCFNESEYLIFDAILHTEILFNAEFSEENIWR